MIDFKRPDGFWKPKFEVELEVRKFESTYAAKCEQLDSTVEALEALKELSGFYYKRSVPHQFGLDHCMCRDCTDKRVYTALETLSKLKTNKDGE